MIFIARGQQFMIVSCRLPDNYNEIPGRLPDMDQQASHSLFENCFSAPACETIYVGDCNGADATIRQQGRAQSPG
jgi:hypothetical protein